jgi:Mn2+/Fe2+ NRAMP family transporter
MGEFVNGALTHAVAIIGAAVVLALNGFLIWQVLVG